MGSGGRNEPAHLPKDAVMNVLNNTNAVIPNVPRGRFEQISVLASNVVEMLKPLHTKDAKELVAEIIKQQTTLKEARLAIENADTSYEEARIAFKESSALADLLIRGGVTLGKIFKYPEIVDFANQDEAVLLTVEGMINTFNNRGEFGKSVATRMAEVLKEFEQSSSAFTRATEEYDRLNQSFSSAYRELSASIGVARAICVKFGIEPPRVTPPSKKKAKDAVQPAPTPVAPASPSLVMEDPS